MSSNTKKAFIITGPTSGIGYYTALQLAKHGLLVLVGRSQARLDATKKDVVKAGGEAVTVLCDMAELGSVRKAATEIVALKLNLAALINNAGINSPKVAQNSNGWDSQWATNHMGPFVLTELLVPHLPPGANVVFLASGVEDPERGPARMAGFRGSRYISAEASARGEWLAPGNSEKPGFDAYATSKQATLVSCLAFAREYPQLHFNAVEPGFSPASNLHRDAPWLLRMIAVYVLGSLAPYIKMWSTPQRAGVVVKDIALNERGATGVYYDEEGVPMKASKQASEEAFQDRVVAETRALLKTVA